MTGTDAEPRLAAAELIKEAEQSMGKATDVLVHTDGSCLSNPGGPGGFAAVLIYGKHRREISGGFQSTTNQRAEILAALAALEALKWPCVVTVQTDSRYLANGARWSKGWRKRGWTKRNGQPVKNADLWKRLAALCGRHRVRFTWVKGHNAGNVENERCDLLAKKAARGCDLPADVGYEQARALQPISD